MTLVARDVAYQQSGIERTAWPPRGGSPPLGIELDRPAGAVVDACRERGLLVLSAGPDVLRLTPPLVVTAAEVEQALAVIGEVLSA